MDLESVDQAIDLYYAAQKYILPKLVDKCIKYIMENLSPENVFRVLDFTQICDDKNLKVLNLFHILIIVYDCTFQVKT